MGLPVRKLPRLKGHDYGSNGVYFLTVCSKNKACIFSHFVGRGILDAPKVRLTEYGKYVEETIIFLNKQTDIINVENYVIMPNHLHLLVSIRNIEGNGGASRMPRPTEAVIPKLISSLKRFSNKKCNADLWQDSYYDHIVRDESDYLTHSQYIDENPQKWTEDELYG